MCYRKKLLANRQILGNYDERLSNGSVDEAAKKEILDSVLSTFLAVQNTAETGFQDLSSTHAQVRGGF
jgi:hypothetical protein